MEVKYPQRSKFAPQKKARIILESINVGKVLADSIAPMAQKKARIILESINARDQRGITVL